MTSTQTERQLIAAAQAGDRAALNELLTYHWQPIYHFISYKVGNQEDAKDLAQETFVRAFRALPRYQERNATFRTYLGRIALNIIADHWRRLGRKPQTVDVTDYRGLLEDPSEKPEDCIVKSERQREVNAALEKLPKEQRQVVEMRLLAGFSVQETAQRLQKTEGSIKMLQQRALINLRKQLQDNAKKPGGDTHDTGSITKRGTFKSY